MLIDATFTKDIKAIAENEIINESQVNILISTDELLANSKQIYEKYKSEARLSPRDNIYLQVDGSIFGDKENLPKTSFQLLSEIGTGIEYFNLHNVSKLCGFELLFSLIDLRKKGYIKVISL